MIITELTAQSAPTGRVTSSTAGDWLERCWQTNWRYGIIERQWSLELEQHEVAAKLARRATEFCVLYDLRDTDALGVSVRLLTVMHSDHDRVLFWSADETIAQ